MSGKLGLGEQFGNRQPWWFGNERPAETTRQHLDRSALQFFSSGVQSQIATVWTMVPLQYQARTAVHGTGTYHSPRSAVRIMKKKSDCPHGWSWIISPS